MADSSDQDVAMHKSEHGQLDPTVSSPGREGLTGTTDANLYKRSAEGETITIPPDGRPYEEQPGWRQDFPIDWPQDHYVIRREFVKFLVLTSGALVTGQLWIAFQNWRRSQNQPPAKRIAANDELPLNGTKVFAYPGEHDNCVLIRTSDDEFLAYSQKCTHLSCAVIPKPEENIIHCPCHAGFFDLKTGNVLAGPPPRPLPKILLEIRSDGIYATGIEWRTI